VAHHCSSATTKTSGFRNILTRKKLPVVSALLVTKFKYFPACSPVRLFLVSNIYGVAVRVEGWVDCKTGRILGISLAGVGDVGERDSDDGQAGLAAAGVSPRAAVVARVALQLEARPARPPVCPELASDGHHSVAVVAEVAALPTCTPRGRQLGEGGTGEI
jgi:hypothetical protein